MFGLTPQAIAIQAGPLTIYWYGIIITVAVLVCWLLGRRLADRFGASKIHLDTMLAWLIIGGVLGARIFEVIFFSPQYYFSNPLEILKIWNGGLSILGAAVGGGLAAWIYCRHYKLAWLNYADLLAVVLPLGQALGRWGNFFNQELYGVPTTGKLGIYIDLQHRVPGYEFYSYFQPMFLYESILDLILFFALLIYSRRPEKQPGNILSLYILGYGLIRFVLEFWHIDPAPVVLGLRSPQWLALAAIAGAVVYWVRKRHSSRLEQK